MLEGLDKVDWRSLAHAYGSAGDVPDLVRALAFGEKNEREEALESLYCNIFHQGSRYQATPYAVPFLLELISFKDRPDKCALVYFLVNLALGFEEAYLPNGLDAEILRQTIEKQVAQASPTERDNWDQWGVGPQVELDCYSAVRQGVPALIRLLSDGDIAVNRAATYALAWFPEDATLSLPALATLLAPESTDKGIANTILSMGLLTRNSKTHWKTESWRNFLSHGSVIVRTAAAIALAQNPLEAGLIDILLNAVLSPGELQKLGDEIRFNNGDLAGYASLVLARDGGPAKARVVPALCQQLEHSNAMQSMDVTRALLSLVLAGKTQPLKDRSPDSLDLLEIAALRAVAKHGGWKIAGGTFANFSELARSFGIPDPQEALVHYLNLRAK